MISRFARRVGVAGVGPLLMAGVGLYQLARTPAFHDVASGDNSWNGVTGYPATGGWDPATGLGTPDAYTLVQELKTTTP